MRVVMIMLVRMRSLVVAVLMSVLNMRVFWSRIRGMRMLMLRVIVGVQVGMYDFVVRVRMRMLIHIYFKNSSVSGSWPSIDSTNLHLPASCGAPPQAWHLLQKPMPSWRFLKFG